MTITNPHQTKIRVYLVLAIVFAVAGIALILAGAGIGLGVLFFILAIMSGVFRFSFVRESKRQSATPEMGDALEGSDDVEAIAATANPYMQFMLFGGIGAAVVGAIIAMSGAGASQDAVRSNEMLMALGGLQYFEPDAGAAGLGWMQFGIAVLIVGVVLLIALLTLKAAKAK